MPGLVPGIHVFTASQRTKTWMAGASPAMTAWQGGSTRQRCSFCSLRVADVASAVAADPHVGLLGVGRETLEDAQARAVFANLRARLVGHDFLIGTGLQEFSYPQPAGVARRLLGRQRVVGA